MENEVKISAIEVQKELMKSKVVAKLSHYTSGNMYYTVELEGGIFQFPIGTVQTGTLAEIVGPCKTIGASDKNSLKVNYLDVNGLYTAESVKKHEEEKENAPVDKDMLIGPPVETKVSKLSEDLGTTTFHAEMRGSELNRWIKMAIKNEEFIKIN